MTTFLITITLFFLFSFNIYTNYYHYKFYAYNVLFNLVLSYFIFIHSNILYSLFFLYISNSSCYFATFFKSNHFCHPPNDKNHNFIANVSKSYVAILVSGIFFVAVAHGGATAFILPIKILLGINIIWTLTPQKYTKFKTEISPDLKSPVCGFNANISTNATLLSLMMPFALINFDENIYLNTSLLIMSTIAIVKTTASIGLFAQICGLVVFLFLYLGISFSSLVAIVLLGTVTLLVAIAITLKFKPKSRLFSISGRDNIYRFTKKWIMPRMHKYFGIGVGSLTYVFPATHHQMESQQLNQFRIGNYIWLHNDVLQFYIEGGIVGLILALLAYFYSVYLCIINSNYAGLCFLISYAINSLGNFPNHLVPDIVISIIMFCFISNF